MHHLQFHIDRTGWVSGNALAIGVTGTDRREADSYNSSSSDAPLLYIRYDTFNLFYVLEIDTNSVPQPDYDLTTTNIYPVVFTSIPAADCGNNFGFFNRIGQWPLPLNITDFSVQLHYNGSVELNWDVDTEYATSSYEVERATDAVSFELMDFVKVPTNTTEAKSYSLFDHEPLNGDNYYRVASIDLDGKRFYTNIRSVYLENASTNIKLYPNQISSGDNLHFHMDENPESVILVEIIDIEGRIVNSLYVEAVSKQFSLNPGSLKSGMYFAAISFDNTMIVEKFVAW